MSSAKTHAVATDVDAYYANRHRLRRWWCIHSLRTALAAAVSLYVARALGLPEAFWAPVSTLVVMQSRLKAALRVSLERIAGTAIGCGIGIALVKYFGQNGLVFGAAILVVGLLCPLVGLDRTAYRFAGITLCIVMLVARPQAAWVVGVHRFVEVSVGIAVALVVTALWPHAEEPER